jgi:endoglucanase
MSLLYPLFLTADTIGLQRGINVSHWLSQSGKRGTEREALFTEEDIQFIQQQGFDHIRLPVDEVQLWDEQGNKEPEAFALLHAAIGWCLEAGLNVLVDLHTLRSYHFNASRRGDKNTLFTDPEAQAYFADLWRDLSAELSRYPVDRVAYELLNEPAAMHSEQWNQVARIGLAAVRETEPDRWVVIGSNQWQTPDKIPELDLPKEDRRIILSIHFYYPFLLTHYQAGWTNIGEYTGPVQYPGPIVPEDVLADEPKYIRDRIYQEWVGGDQPQNKEVLAAFLDKAVAFSRKTKRPLYCGEFGCITIAPRDARLRWHADMVEIFREHDIGWALWDYQGGFRIRDPETGAADQELIDLLM